MEILALLPLIWLMFWIGERKGRRSGKDRLVHIKLANMEDEKSGYRVVYAGKRMLDGKYEAAIWLPRWEERIYLYADTKEELEKMVEEKREELRNPKE